MRVDSNTLNKAYDLMFKLSDEGYNDIDKKDLTIQEQCKLYMIGQLVNKDKVGERLRGRLLFIDHMVNPLIKILRDRNAEIIDSSDGNLKTTMYIDIIGIVDLRCLENKFDNTFMRFRHWSTDEYKNITRISVDISCTSYSEKFSRVSLFYDMFESLYKIEYVDSK